MDDYIELCIRLKVFDPWSDIIDQSLADQGFESFKKETPFIYAYIPKRQFDEAKVRSHLRHFAKVMEADISINTIEQKNWNEEWEANFEPVLISNKLLVRAPFHEKSEAMEIVLTPKMSFGTGHHPTTEQMMEEMLEMDFSQHAVLDVGCGTGILSILAEKLGAARIRAIDIDDWAIENSEENLEINNCQNCIVEKAEVSSVSDSFYNVILANINRNIIIRDMSTYLTLLAEKGEILFSGFYDHDEEDIVNLAKELNLSLINRREREHWVMIHMVRESGGS